MIEYYNSAPCYFQCLGASCASSKILSFNYFTTNFSIIETPSDNSALFCSFNAGFRVLPTAKQLKNDIFCEMLENGSPKASLACLFESMIIRIFFHLQPVNSYIICICGRNLNSEAMMVVTTAGTAPGSRSSSSAGCSAVGGRGSQSHS